jgi:hypothetical protein
MAPPPGFPRSLRADLISLSLLAAAHLVLFQGLLFGGETLYYDDFSRYQLPLWSLVREAYGELRLPLWNPYVWLGTPLAANPAAGAFYPLGLPFMTLDEVSGLNAAVVVHLTLGGCFTYLLARERAGSGAAPFAAAVGFSLGGIALSDAVNPFYLFSLAWLPAALLCYRRALAVRTLFHGVLCGACLALMVLGGDLQLPLIAGVVFLILGVARVGLAPSGIRLRTAARVAGALVLAAAVGAGLAAVQLLPTLELAGLSERAAGLPATVRTHFSFHPARLATLVVPYAFGVPLPENSYWGFELGDGPRFFFFSIYGGALLLAFAFAALRRGDAWGLGLVAAAVALVALALGRHGPFYEPAAQVLPGLDQLRYPEKFLAPLAVIVPALGAEGIARVGREEALGRALAALVLLAVVGAVLWLLESTLAASFAERFPVPFLAESASRRIAGDGRNLLAFAAAAALILAAAWRGWVPMRNATLAFAALAAADVAVAGVRLVWTDRAEALREAPAAAALISGEGPAAERVLRLPALDRVPLHRTLADWQRVVRHLRASLSPNTHVRARIAALAGYGAGAPAGASAVFARFAEDEAPALARRLAAPWLLAADGSEGGLPRIGIFRIPGTVPRARLTGAEVGEGTLESAGPALLRASDGSRALVEAGHALFRGRPLGREEARSRAAALPRDGAGEARITRWRPEEVVVRVRASRAAVLVLAEGFFPGWRAEVDGAEVPIFRADLLARAVPVPAGEHEVAFRYASPALSRGAKVSLATAGALGALGLLALVASWRRRRAPAV